jgi:aminopeptidase N
MGSPAVKRIEDVRTLRAAQFPEDAGPARPSGAARFSYIEISNFYTATIYNKGAELIRMMHTLLGPEKFRAGTDLYFERHDGQAVTCEDFVRAMEEASGVDLEAFRIWYSQAGTPKVKRRLAHEGANGAAPARAAHPADAGPAGQAADADPAEAALCSAPTAAPNMRTGWCCSTSRRRSW